MTFEEFNLRLTSLNAMLYWLQQCDARRSYHPEIQREILAEGEWVVKIVSRIPKLGKWDGRSADGQGRTPSQAFERVIDKWLNPYVYTPKPKPQAIELDLDLGDLEI